MRADDELTSLREEAESLAEFLALLQREYAQLHADFATVLAALEGHVQVVQTDLRSPGRARSRNIEREEDPTTGAVTFRLERDA